MALLACLVVFIVVFLRRRKSKNSQNQDQQTTPIQEKGYQNHEQVLISSENQSAKISENDKTNQYQVFDASSSKNNGTTVYANQPIKTSQPQQQQPQSVNYANSTTISNSNSNTNNNYANASIVSNSIQNENREQYANSPTIINN